MPISKRNNSPLTISIPEEPIVKEEVAKEETKIEEVKEVKQSKPKATVKPATKVQEVKPTPKKAEPKPKVEKQIEVNIEPMVFNKRLNPLSLEKQEEVLPPLPSCTKKAFVLPFVRKDVYSILKAKMGVSSTEILNEALVSLLKEKYKEEYIKLSKGE